MKLKVQSGDYQPCALTAQDRTLITAALRVTIDCAGELVLGPGKVKPDVERNGLDDYLPATGVTVEGTTPWLYPGGAPIWRCHSRTCENATTSRCSGCKAVFFCSQKCQKAEWKTGHKVECPRFKRLTDIEADFATPSTFPMPWCHLTCSSTAVSYEGFLRSNNLFGVGWWKAEWASCHIAPSPPINLTEPIVDIAEGLSLPATQLPSSNISTHPSSQLCSWSEWHEIRGVSLESPAALVLHRALSVYYSICLCAGAGAFELEDTSIEVHLIGVEPEVMQLGALSEVAALLPSTRIRFVLVGPAVPEEFNGWNGDLGVNGATAVLYSTDYMTYSKSGERTMPQILIGLNAGLASSHPSVASMIDDPTPIDEVVRYASALQIPCVFTDFTRESAELGSAVCVAASEAEVGVVTIETKLNPFRQPLNLGRAKAHRGGTHSDFPFWSNGFLFGFAFEQT